MCLISKILGSENKFTLEDRILNAVLFVVIQIGLLSLIINIVNKLGFISCLFAFAITIFFGILYFIGRRSSSSRYLVWPFIFLDITPAFFTWYLNGGISGTSLFYFFSLIIVVPIITHGISRVIGLLFITIIPFVLYLLEITQVINVKDYANNSAEQIDTLFSFIFLAIGYIIVIILLIGAYRKQKAELEANNKAKDMFISILAHDLKSPFNSLLGFSELLKEEVENYSNEDLKKYVSIIFDVSKNTYTFLEELLLWAKTQHDNISFNPFEINLLQIADECIFQLSKSSEIKNIEILNEISLNFTVFADVNMLKTILRNLISNAVKFTPKFGKITISATKQNNFSEIIISDTGMGMDTLTLQSLFKLGKTISLKGTEGERGTGFGLLLCKEFVDKHGGKIFVESELGKGSNFKISIPNKNKEKI